MNLPVPIKNVGLLYPYSVKDVCEFGISRYYQSLGILLLTQEEIKKFFKEEEEITPLNFLIKNAESDNSFLLELQHNLFTLFREEVLILPKINSILIGSPEKKHLLNNTNFSTFQDILRVQNLITVKAEPPKDESPWEKKMRERREKVEEIKRKKAKNLIHSNFTESLSNAIVYGLDIDNCSFFRFQKTYPKMQSKEKWDTDIQMICAGADSSKIETKYWGESSKQ